MPPQATQAWLKQLTASVITFNHSTVPTGLAANRHAMKYKTADCAELGYIHIRVGLHSGPVMGAVVGTLNRR